MSKNNGWIKCSERFPSPPQNVLICNKDGDIRVAMYQKLTGFGVLQLFGNPTHWQPLPELPQD